MAAVTRKINFNTGKNFDCVNITGEIEDALESVPFEDGIVTVFCPGSTGAISTVEYEPGLVKDLGKFFEQLIPQQGTYQHNAEANDDNGHSHVRATLVGPSVTIPFNGRQLLLGTWQQVIFLGFDVPDRKREVILQFVG